jgi:succinate dehydrogenase/fumarate reductase-like Fe-S protein
MSTFQLDPNQVALGVPSLGATQVFIVTTGSIQSTAFGASTTMVRVSCSSGHCHFQVGTNPTASVTTSPMMPNNFSEIIRVTPGQKIAVIKDASVTASTFSVTELI